MAAEKVKTGLVCVGLEGERMIWAGSSTRRP